MEAISAVRHCLDAGLGLSLHATGHAFTADSLAGEVVVTLSGMRDVWYEPGSQHVHVQAGATVDDVNRVLFPRQRAISTGTSPTVGVAGLLHGGGAAYTSRARGLTCDALVGTRLLTYTGEILDVTDESHPGLMWALRGGGAGLLGVPLRTTLATYATFVVDTFAGTTEPDPELLSRLEQALIDAPGSCRCGSVSSRWMVEPLLAHEFAPGHHLQFEAARATTRPDYLDTAWFNSTIEGWGVLAEALARDFGMYSSWRSDVGALGLELLRAARLVVDTGLHALGWTTTRCISYLRHNTLLTESQAASELARYTEYPGQALSYQMGKRALCELLRTGEPAAENRIATFLAAGIVPPNVAGLLFDLRSGQQKHG